MAQQTTPVTVDVTGLNTLNLSMGESLELVEEALQGEGCFKIGFVNADCINISAKDQGYRDDLGQMDWLFIDGIGMKIAGKILGEPVRDNVNGTDMFPLLCDRLARKGQSIFLLGARPGVADKVADWAKTHFPGLHVAGCHHGYFNHDDSSEVVEKIRCSGASVLLVAFGAPRQERWIREYAEATGVKVAMGVGGLFDFYSGRIPRAPFWMRKLGMEWIFRLIQEPGRMWRRYLLGNFSFIFKVLAYKMSTCCRRSGA